jgi:hypothetical protein
MHQASGWKGSILELGGAGQARVQQNQAPAHFNLDSRADDAIRPADLDCRRPDRALDIRTEGQDDRLIQRQRRSGRTAPIRQPQRRDRRGGVRASDGPRRSESAGDEGRSEQAYQANGILT